MTTTLLAGDIGGTKTNLALYDVASLDRHVPIREASYRSRDFPGLEDVVRAFLAGHDERIVSAAFGIAGPVFDGVVQATNFPWRVEAASISAELGGVPVRLMNDLETTAYGALFLPPDEIETLQTGLERRGHIAVIAAGTGLGQGYLYFDGERHHPVATEGGHVDFAPRNETDFRLLSFLKRTYPRVSYERVLSGPGLVNVFEFLRDDLGRPVAEEIRERLKQEDPGAVIGRAGIDGECSTCVEAVDLFISLYGAQAGNLALTVMSLGGVYVGGGIVTKMMPKIRSGAFLEAFLDKGRYRALMSEVPVRVILNPKASMIGAAHAAAELVVPARG